MLKRIIKICAGIFILYIIPQIFLDHYIQNNSRIFFGIGFILGQVFFAVMDHIYFKEFCKKTDLLLKEFKGENNEHFKLIEILNPSLDKINKSETVLPFPPVHQCYDCKGTGSVNFTVTEVQSGKDNQSKFKCLNCNGTGRKK